MVTRRIAVWPQPQEDQAGDKQHDLINAEDRRVGMEPVEAVAGEGRAETDPEAEHPEHRAVYLCVVSEPEIAAGKERHQVDLSADPQPEADGADKRRRARRMAH